MRLVRVLQRDTGLEVVIAANRLVATVSSVLCRWRSCEFITELGDNIMVTVTSRSWPSVTTKKKNTS